MSTINGRVKSGFITTDGAAFTDAYKAEAHQIALNEMEREMPAFLEYMDKIYADKTNGSYTYQKEFVKAVVFFWLQYKAEVSPRPAEMSVPFED